MGLTIIYRNSDKLVAGWIPDTMDANAEITNNIITSELGGVVTDYGTSTYSGNALPKDHEFIVDPVTTVVTTQERTEITQRNSDRDSAITKLKGATWSPLTDTELKAIFEIGTS